MKFLSFFVMAVALLFGGCAATGTVAPQSLDEGLGAVEAQVSGLEQSAAQAVTAGTFKKADAQQVLSIGDQVVTLITAARAAEKTGDTSTAQGKLALATTLVAQLATYLTAHGVK
jgi:hypothetical protein